MVNAAVCPLRLNEITVMKLLHDHIDKRKLLFTSSLLWLVDKNSIVSSGKWNNICWRCAKKQSKKSIRKYCVCARYLRHTAAGVGVAGCVVAEGRQAGQDEVDGADLQSHAAQQHAVVGGQRRAAEQSSQHVEGQRGQDVGRRRLQDVTCRGGLDGAKARKNQNSRGPYMLQLVENTVVEKSFCRELYCTKKISLKFISVQSLNQSNFICIAEVQP